ncbi:hypothetical protein [Streptomyces viridochromogenes]|nr:hypothetical protein [Streptomyces viridochromogenes]
MKPRTLMKAGSRRLGVLAPALALVLIPFSSGTASANTSPGWGDDKPDVIWDCNNGKADSCQYHEVKAWTQLGKRRQVGNPVYNCAGKRDLDVERWWTASRTTSYSFQQETSHEVSAGFSDTISAGVSVSSSQTEKWEVGRTSTTSNKLTAHVPPGMAGGYWFAPYWRKSQGWIEVHYGKRKNGHYFWYYPGKGSRGVEINTPVFNSDGEMKGKWYWAVWNC